MMTYSLIACLKKYGAAGYLAGLRSRYRAGVYSHGDFVCAAARAYLALLKPLRARALLETIDLREAWPGLQERVLALKTEASAMAPGTDPTCSLNMIVKNECLNIGPALDCVDDIMDEIIVGDTGSTDRTADIARLFGATVISTGWRDDFSSARNEAVHASACSWILWLDADDRFDRSSKYDLVTLWKTAPPQAAAFCVINEQNGRHGARFMQVRLFPRMRGMLFERRVHEQIMFSAVRCKVPFSQFPAIRIIHKGYNDPKTRKAKSARYKPLIIAELQEHPGDPALLLNYGDCCVALGELDEAHASYSRITGDTAQHRAHPDVFVQAHFAVGCIHYKKREFTHAKHWFSQCVRFDPTRTEALYLLGRILEEEGDEEAAFDYYLKSARCTPPLRQTATDAMKIRIESIHCLARLLLKARRFREAEDLLLHALADFPQVVEYHTALGTALLRQQKLKDAAIFFMQSLSLCAEGNGEAYEGMARIYETMHDYGKAKLFMEMANK